MSLFGALLNKTEPKTPVPMVGRSAGGLFGSFLGLRGVTQQLSAMETVGTVFGIVDKLAMGVSLVEWQLWRKAKSGKKDDRTEITSHAALDTWNRPNKFFTRQELVECGQQHAELTGETWLVAGRLGGSVPLELWPVRPDRMEPVPSAETFLAGYLYRGFEGELVPLEQRDVFMMRRPDPNNPYRGLGPIRPILVDIDSSRYAAEWNRNFFLNSAEPGGIIEVPKALSDDEFNQLRDRWAEQHKGVANSHRVALLEHGKWIERKYSMRDMQFAELRGVTSTAIREAFGFPKFMLGQVDDVNRANAEASEAMFGQWLLVPRLERWKQMLNTEFLPQFGSTAQGLEFDYVSPVPANSEAENASRTSRVQAVATLVPLGADFADAMEKFGLPEIKFEKPTPPPAPSGVPGVPGGPAADPMLALLAGRPRAVVDPLEALLGPVNHPGGPGHRQDSHGRRYGPKRGEPLTRLAESLASGEVSRTPLSGGQWANVDLIELGNGSKAVRKAQLKPIEGRPAREVQDAEELGASVLRMFGIRAPETHRASARVVFQEYMDGTSAETLPRQPSSFLAETDLYDSDQGRILGLADALMYNYDRRSANWMFDRDGSLVGIDHGMAFAWTYHKPGSPHADGDDNGFWNYLAGYESGKGLVWRDNDLSPQDIATARGLVKLLRPEFERLGRLDWNENMLVTLDAIEPHAKGTRARFS